MVGIIQCDGHIGISQRLAQLCTGENDVLHGATAQLPGALLSQHPAHGIRDIALAGAVGAHYARYTVMEFQLYLIGEGFEALDLNTFQIHVASFH